jgi:hypothetical protein
MRSDTRQNRWELRKDQILLGILDQSDLDWPWVMCQFHAAPEYEIYQPLFNEELRILDEGNLNTVAWEMAYQKITDLQLTLHAIKDGHVYKQFLLHIKDNEAWFRLYEE